MNALAAPSPFEKSYEQARDNCEPIVGYLDSEEPSSMTHSELEKNGRELMRIISQKHLKIRTLITFILL
ncbi:MAG: hypothetical protein SV775_04890 [Thermodesulfobacteriota bacterium]|nr:hypothetical protein [Thermodesulfobacteriota bacterium]